MARLCRIAIHHSNLEQLVLLLNELWDRGSAPSIVIIQQAIRLACDHGLPRLAIGITQQHDRVNGGVSRISTASWVRILISSAENSFVST